MGYATSSPPRLLVQSLGGGGAMWYYESADAIATVNTAAYVSNGDALGMKVGHTVIVRDTATPTTSLCTVISVTAGSSVDLSDGTAISQTNSD